MERHLKDTWEGQTCWLWKTRRGDPVEETPLHWRGREGPPSAAACMAQPPTPPYSMSRGPWWHSCHLQTPCPPSWSRSSLLIRHRRLLVTERVSHVCFLEHARAVAGRTEVFAATSSEREIKTRACVSCDGGSIVSFLKQGPLKPPCGSAPAWVPSISDAHTAHGGTRRGGTQHGGTAFFLVGFWGFFSVFLVCKFRPKRVE